MKYETPKKSIVLFLTGIFFLLSKGALSQPEFVPLNNQINFRYEPLIYNRDTNFHTAIKPYLYTEIKKAVETDSLINASPGNTRLQTINQKLKEKLRFSKRTFSAGIAPHISLLGGYSTNPNSAFLNAGIGAKVYASYGKKWHLSGSFVLVSRQLPGFVHATPSFSRLDSNKIIPHFGQYLNKNDNRYLYFMPHAYCSYSPHERFNFQLGYGKNFWGDGYRSLILSDNANAYPFFKTTANVWRLKYVILYTALSDIDISEGLSGELHRQYSTMHLVSWNITNRINVHLSEAVLWNSTDSIGARGFDVNYLNPILFFRPVEFSLGSPDNVLLSMGFRIKIAKKVHLYGQGVLDEFILSEIKKRNGWWGNKYGFQGGIKSFDTFGIKQFYVQVEGNIVRPYTYSHQSSLQNHGHFAQALAHQLGANFQEGIFLVRYRYKRWFFTSKSILARYGSDTGDYNFGGDIYKSYEERKTYEEDPDYRNTIAQGIENTVFHQEAKAAFILSASLNLQAETGFMFRYHTQVAENKQYLYLFAGIRTLLYNH